MIIDRLKESARKYFVEAPKELPLVPVADKSRVPRNEIGVAQSMLFSAGDFIKYDPDQLKINKGNEIYKSMCFMRLRGFVFS